jgi:hypothetical protein
MYELASPEWFAAITDSLQRAVSGLDLGGRTYSISEEFTDPPGHLVAAGEKSIGWHFRVTDGRVEVGEGALDDADLVTVIDYDTCLPAARQVYGNDPAVFAQVKQRRDELTAAGKMTRRGDDAVPPELLARLLTVHDEMARQTL